LFASRASIAAVDGDAGPTSGGREIGRRENTGGDVNAGGKLSGKTIPGGRGWKRAGKRKEERKRRHIGNNEGEGYVCVALSA